jgi:DNA repair exonuclease SbcCD ATPase subunit
MIEFISISLRNFLSYGNNLTTVPLNISGTTLIVGENLDHIDGGSNGVGKSTAVLTALVYVLFDKSPRKVPVDSLVNNVNKKQMEVILEFAVNGKHYKIHRMRKMKAGAEGNKVFFYEDGKDITVVPNGDTNKIIAQTIGIPADMFEQIVAFKASTEGFLDLPSPKQKEFIEEIFGITVISDKADKLRTLIKDTKKELVHKKSTIDQLIREHERHSTLIETAKRRVSDWVIQNAKTVADLKTKLAKIDNIDFDAERELHAKVAEVQSAIRELRSELKLEDRTIADLNTALRKIAEELIHLRDNKCPYCMQGHPDAATNITRLSTQQIALNEELAEATEVRQMISRKITQLEREAETVSAKITVPNLTELLAIRDQASSFRQRIAEGEVAQNPYEEPLQELLDVKLDEVDYEQANALDKELKHQDFLLKLLTKNDSFVRKALLNKNLPYLNKQLKNYLADLGLPHSIEFTHELDVMITKLGSEFDVGLMSTGQRARIHFALSLAFRDVRSRLYGRTNLTVFDEVLDYGLDAGGVTACAYLIKHLARTHKTSTFVISHRAEIDGMFDRKMTVQLSKGFSGILQEPLPA